MAFQLYDKIVALHLGNTTANAYLCNQVGRVYVFLCRLAFCILNICDKHGIPVIAHSYLPISMWK